MAEPYAQFEAARLVLALRQAGVTDQRIAEAMEKTPREPFVPAAFRDHAWENVELPIDCGQTLTRPVMIGQALTALDVHREHTVLEIGTGSGYAAAILSRLCRRVYSIDRYRTLTERARATLDQLGLSRVELRFADGLKGWPEAAPFGRIVLWGAVGDLPELLSRQVSTDHGVALAPVGQGVGQQLVRFARQLDGAFQRTALGPSRFMPLQAGVAREL